MGLTDLIVVSPVYDDWEAVTLLVPRLDAELARYGAQARLVLVNDGSSLPPPDSLSLGAWSGIREIRVLTLRRNIGHQRALAIGLAFIHQQMPCDVVVVMDADGEDNPADVPRLLDEASRHRGESVVFARRVRRSEGMWFTLLYRLYRTVHRVMTGISVQVGNFSVVPYRLLGRLVIMSELWNHYAAAVFQSRVPYAMIPTARSSRLSGRSRMNLVSLVVHGLSAVAVFADRVGVRLLITAIVALGAVIAAAVGIAGYWLLTGISPAPWVVGLAALTIVVLIQVVAAASLFVLQVLFARASATFIPARDYPFFVESDDTIWRPVL
jgi:hypothetical protein